MNIANLKFSLNFFRRLDLPDLLINICDYADKPNCAICKQYQEWCITAAKEQWQKEFIDFDFFIDALKKQNKNWFNVGKTSLATKN